MIVEIDQSGKLEQLDTGTAVAFSNGETGTVWLSAGVKRQVVLHLRKTLIPSHDLWAVLFAIVIFLLVSDLGENVILRIDEEYTGKEGVIKEVLEKLLVRKWGKKWEGGIRFGRIGKESEAHKLCWSTHRKKNRQKVRSLKSKEILKLL
jgi:hypothetical protein